MAYLFVLLLSTFYLGMYQRYGVDFRCRLVFFIMAFLPVFFIPAFQYGVGADYFSYTNHVLNPELDAVFLKKGEYLVVFIFNVIRYLGIGSQYFFIISSFLMTVMLFALLVKLGRHGYRVWLVFLIWFVFSGMFHNQMNGIRNYLAIYCFLLAIMCRLDKSYVLLFVSIFIGLISHRSFIYVLPLIFVPGFFLLFVARNYIYFLLLLIVVVPVFTQVISFPQMVRDYAGLYSHYSEKEYFSSGVGFLGSITKIYYIPFFIFFGVYIRKFNPSALSMKMSVYWIFALLFLLLMIEYGAFFRFYSYFVFFGVVPVYFIMNYLLCNNSVGFILAMTYLVFPYLLKVLFFADGEYLFCLTFMC